MTSSSKLLSVKTITSSGFPQFPDEDEDEDDEEDDDFPDFPLYLSETAYFI